MTTIQTNKFFKCIAVILTASTLLFSCQSQNEQKEKELLQKENELLKKENELLQKETSEPNNSSDKKTTKNNNAKRNERRRKDNSCRKKLYKRRRKTLECGPKGNQRSKDRSSCERKNQTTLQTPTDINKTTS